MSVPPPLPKTVVDRPGWWRRHWRWAVPVVCVAGFALFMGAIFALMSVVFGSMQDSEPYRSAMREARENADVVQALGLPIEDGWMTSGSFQSAGTREDARLSISIEGPKGDGTIHVEASSRNGAWTYAVLLVKVGGRDERIDLLPGLPPEQRGASPEDTADSGPEAPAPEDESAQDDAAHDNTVQNDTAQENPARGADTTR